jgi:hypothetical protein
MSLKPPCFIVSSESASVKAVVASVVASFCKPIFE